MIAGYFFVKRQQLDVRALYSRAGRYGRVQWPALAALFLGILPHLPGFLVQINMLASAQVPTFFQVLYNFSWFSGFAIAFSLYLIFKKIWSST